MLIEKAGGKVVIVPGSYHNIKITTQEDLVIAKAILKSKKVKAKLPCLKLVAIVSEHNVLLVWLSSGNYLPHAPL